MVEFTPEAYSQLETVIQSLLSKTQDLEHQLTAVTPSPPLATFSRPAEPDAAPPEFFTGNTTQLRYFLTQCQQVFYLQPSKFPNGIVKVMYATTHLQGSAYAWIQPYLNQDVLPDWMNNFPSFSRKIISVFGDPDLACTSIWKLEGLKQTKSAATYAAEFCCHSVFTQWNDEALCHLFYKGLKDAVKDDLAHYDRPDSLDDLIDLSIKLDNCLYECSLEHGPTCLTTHHTQAEVAHSVTSHPTPTHPTGTVHTPSSAGPHPMELDASRTRHQALTPQERARHMENNLCLYCGNPGHIANSCPICPPRHFQVSATLLENFPAQMEH